MVSANLALWRPLELVRACDSAQPSRKCTVPAPELAVSPRVTSVTSRVPAVTPRDSLPSESRVFTRGGLPVGWCSREFSTQELLAYTCPKEPMIVFIEAHECVAAAACARLAGSVPGAALRLERAVTSPCRAHRADRAGGAWRVRCVTAAPPGELRLWFHHDLLQLFGIPHLSPHNIIHSSRYECGACGAVFAEPNPLKVHAALRCAGARRELWARAAGSVAPGVAGSVAGSMAPSSLPACPAAAERLAAALGSHSGRGGAHACVYCGRVYSRRYGLRIHVRTHTGWRPLRCAVCRRAFADPSNLNKHNKLHRLRGDTAPAPAPAPADPAPTSDTQNSHSTLF